MTDIYGYAAAAPLYRAAGWMQVIPLPEGRKTPPPSGFTGRSRKPVTDEQVRFWSQSDPTANTGIVIPEGVLVLDIDAEQGHQVKADGAKGISELSQELGMLPATWSSTAHGIDSPARHLFYKVPEGLAWKGGAIEGVDILQPGHRYSVVWPSIHPSGEMYCWYTPSGSTTSQIPHISDLATLPWKWVDYLRKPEHTTPRPTSNTLISPETGTYDARMCKAINTFFMVNTVKPGQQRLKARHHPAGRMGARQLRAGRPPGRARRHQPAQTTIHPRGRPRPSGQGTRGRTRMGQHSQRRDGEGQRRTSARGPMRAVEDRTHDARRVQRTHPKHDCESNEGKSSASSSKH